MNRFGLLTLSLATLVTLAPTCSRAGQPNFLLIVSEDNGPELGTYGDPYARTPNLDRLPQTAFGSIEPSSRKLGAALRGRAS